MIMTRGSREKDIKLLVAKFIKLVESLNPGERLSIRKVAAKKKATAEKSARAGSQRSQAKRVKP
jgi:lipid A disaccharide synthetase